MSILIVDDEKDIRESLKELLKIAGYDAVTASSGLEAMECVDRGGIDLILVDLSMPGMTGQEFLRNLDGRQGRPPALVITALAPWHILDLVKSGVGYLRKPIDCDLLLGAIKTYMGKEEGNGHKSLG
ncbi:MAG: hypothetical protein Kow0025_16920 [Thermodesulfovibrionales bacterium]